MICVTFKFINIIRKYSVTKTFQSFELGLADAPGAVRYGAWCGHFGAVRCGAQHIFSNPVRSGAERCGAKEKIKVRCGAVRKGKLEVRCGAVRGAASGAHRTEVDVYCDDHLFVRLHIR